MQTPQVQKLLVAIPKAEQTMRFVGGCVRDGLLGIPVKDVDLATSYQPQEIMEFLKEHKIKTFPIGLDHGTVLAVVDGTPFEITTLRKDIETDGRHAKVAFTDDWLEDAKRRDFTFNALYLTPEGKLYDPWLGYEDLMAGRVQFIGDPRERIQEDYLRILRYFRFHARFGRLSPDAETFAALKDLAGGLTKISGERIHNELFRLLEHPDPRPAFQLMFETGVLQVCLHLTHISLKFHQLVGLEQRLTLPAGVLRRFLSLFMDEPEPMLKIERRLKFSNKEKKHLSNLQELLSHKDLSDHWLLYYYGAEVFKDLLLLNPPDDNLQSKLALAESWQPKKLPVRGDDLIKIGIEAGPELGAALKKVEAWWISMGFTPSKAECLSYIKTFNKT